MHRISKTNGGHPLVDLLQSSVLHDTLSWNLMTWNKHHGDMHVHTSQTQRTRHKQYSNARRITSCASHMHPRSTRLEKNYQPLWQGLRECSNLTPPPPTTNTLPSPLPAQPPPRYLPTFYYANRLLGKSEISAELLSDISPLPARRLPTTTSIFLQILFLEGSQRDETLLQDKSVRELVSLEHHLDTII